jgi:hypothetical protein
MGGRLKRVLWWVVAAIGGCMMFLAENSPESVQSNIASWVQFFGHAAPPGWLISPAVDSWVFAAGAVAATVSALAIIWPLIRVLKWRHTAKNRQDERQTALRIAEKASKLAQDIFEYERVNSPREQSFGWHFKHYGKTLDDSDMREEWAEAARERVERDSRYTQIFSERFDARLHEVAQEAIRYNIIS